MNFVLELRLDPARADETPAADGFKNGEKTRHHKNQSPQRIVAGDDDSGHEAKRPDDAARHAPVTIKVRPEKSVHAGKLAQCMPKTIDYLQEALAIGQGCGILSTNAG